LKNKLRAEGFCSADERYTRWTS